MGERDGSGQTDLEVLGPRGEPLEEWRVNVNRRLEEYDLAIVELRVFLEELMARQVRHGLDGWMPEAP